MSEAVKASQQQKDTRAQNDLTAKVGVRLPRPEKSTTSMGSRIKRLLRMG